MRLSIEILPLLYKFSLQPLQPIEPSSPARMVVLLLLLLGLGQTQALGKPGRGQPAVEKGLKILRLIYSFLHANILTPYSLLPLPLHASKLGALLSRRKLGKDTKVPYPRPGVGTMGRCCIRIVITYQESAAMVFMRCE